MKVDFIQSVVFGKLRTDSYDRRGAIATFALKVVPNMEYMQFKALTLLWSLTSLLSEHFSADHWRDSWDEGRYFAEGNDCWICIHEDDVIQVRHKYWSDEQVQCFVDMVHSLGKLHDWAMEEE